MPFSAWYVLVSIFSVLGIFLFTFRKRGLKFALLISLLGFGIMIATFLLLLSTLLNNMG